MLRARLTSRGRVTIPMDIRVRYQLQPGDEVDFRADRSSLRLVSVTKRKLTELHGALPAKSRPVDKTTERNEISRMLGAGLHRRVPRQ